MKCDKCGAEHKLTKKKEEWEDISEEITVRIHRLGELIDIRIIHNGNEIGVIEPDGIRMFTTYEYNHKAKACGRYWTISKKVGN